MKPIAVDLCCGLGGWSAGLIAEGWDAVGFDVERHHYGDAKYPGQLVLQDILTLDGRQFRGKVSLIVASPPCTEYSYMAMPWKRAKQIAVALRGRGDFPDGYTGSRNIEELNRLFNACFRISREAECPVVIENVRGAQPWVGRSKWAFGSFYLWGDVPALMPMTRNRKSVGSWFSDGNGATIERNDPRDAHLQRATKNAGGSWFAVAHNTTSGHGQNPDGRKVPSESGRRTDVGNGVRFTSRDCGMENTIANAQDGCKQRGSGHAWYRGEIGTLPSKSSARKAASAHIAKIPIALSRHIARAWWPAESPQRRARGY